MTFGITHIRKIVTYYFKSHDIERKNPFSEIRLNEAANQRLPFSLDFLRDRWLDGAALEGLNSDAKGVLLAMLDTGCGAGELCGLAADDIKLDAAIPHIIIRANEFRKLKTNHRGRTIPLVGYSLEAFAQNPAGFPRYRRPNGADSLSGNLMKYLRTHRLLETPKHKVYGLRHTFKDRMRTHQFPDELQNYLMGHIDRTMGSRYGSRDQLDLSYRYMKLLEADWIEESVATVGDI
jgi:integrase